MAASFNTTTHWLESATRYIQLSKARGYEFEIVEFDITHESPYFNPRAIFNILDSRYPVLNLRMSFVGIYKGGSRSPQQ